MTNQFLKAKHWQIFLLTFGIPVAIQLIIVAVLVIRFSSGAEQAEQSVFDFMTYMYAAILILLLFFFGWLWSIAVGLQKMIPQTLRLKVNRFKIFFFIPLIYLSLFIVLIALMMSGLSEGHPETLPSSAKVVFLVVFPLHLFSVFCIFYCLWFAAKTFKTAELQQKVSFSDFAGEFFMLWFYPVGVWIIQPKINTLAARSGNENQDF